MYVHRNTVQFPTYHLDVLLVVVVAVFSECFVAAVASKCYFFGGLFVRTFFFSFSDCLLSCCV